MCPKNAEAGKQDHNFRRQVVNHWRVNGEIMAREGGAWVPVPIGKGPLIPFHFVGKESDRVRGGSKEAVRRSK